MASTHAIRSWAIAAGVLAATILPMAVGSAGAAGATSARGLASSQPPLAVTVTSLSQSYATPNQTLVIKGRVWNGTRSTVTDLSVEISFSNSAFGSRTALENFAAGYPVLQAPVAGIAPRTIGKLRSRHGVAWQVKLPVNALRLSCFGVYPLTVGVSNAAGTLTASDRVPLPFWPNKPDTCSQAMRPQPFLISWIWPLIDSPHQGPCPGLLDNALAASLAPGGRLSDLLNVGATYKTAANLTWAIDPALLDNAHTMTTAYQLGRSADCGTSSQHRADPNAGKWLSKLASVTAGQPVFVTPYGDVDVAGLAQYGDITDLRGSFEDGEHVAARLLGRQKTSAQIPAGPKQLSAVAWPAGGQASQAVLENLGAMRIGTVILAMPPTQLNFTPGAVSSVVDGVGTTLKALLADDSLSGLLAAPAARSRQPGTIFSVSQMFLAQTAMIVAEAPSDQRPILVTPPRRWDPARTLASDLLTGTVGAPWLRPVPIGQLAAQPQPANSSLMRPFVHPQLPRKVLKQIPKLDGTVSLLQSIRTAKDPRLSRAVYGIESSGWVAGGEAQAKAMLTRTRDYVARQFAGLSVGGQHVIHVTLGGRVGTVTVSIHNSLNYAVVVGLKVTSSNNSVVAKQKHVHELYVVQPQAIGTLKLSINSAQTGKATLNLRLVSPKGVLLPDKPLTMTIRATNLGTVALVIFAAALALFVVASAAQAIRRGRPGTGEQEPREPDGPEPQPEPQGDQDRPTAQEVTDSVFTEPVPGGTAGRRPTEESR